MKDYTIYVTEEIAKKAMEKGFDCLQAFNITSLNHTFTVNSEQWYYLPTAEQICGWLREEKELRFVIINHHNKSTQIEVYDKENNRLYKNSDRKAFPTYKEALLKAINKALDLI